MKRKLILTIVIMFLIITAILTTKVQAQLQSRPNTLRLVNKSINDFIIMARNMEAPNQSFGLNATIDQSNGTESSASNNIDVHIIKNTEYGAIAMLSASAYGDHPGGTYVSSTNNNTGVYNLSYGQDSQGLNSTMTAASVGTLNFSQKYWNKYTSINSSYKNGDATFETKGWKGSTANAWFTSTAQVLGRDRGLFGFEPITSAANGKTNSRISVVSATGI